MSYNITIGVKKQHMAKAIVEVNHKLNKACDVIHRGINPITGDDVYMDMSDFGNVIGEIAQGLINNDLGDHEDFMNGIRHGMEKLQK